MRGLIRPGSRPLSFLEEPQALAGRPEGWVFLVLCDAFLLLLAAADRFVAPASTGSLQAVPVLAAGWLLSRRQVLSVVLLAAVLRVGAVLGGSLDPLTASSQVAVLPFLAIVSQLAAIAFGSSRTRARQDALISRVAAIASSADNLNAILEQILKEVARDGLRGGTIALIDEQRRLYIAAAEGALDPSVLELRLPVGQGIMGRVAAEGVPLLVNDLDGTAAPPSPTRSIGTNAGMRSIVAVPLRAAGTVIGVLEIDSAQPGYFTEDDLRLLEQLAPAISGAVQRAGALQLADERLRRRVAELSTLLDAARGLVRLLEPAEILQQIVRSSAQIAIPSGSGRRRAMIWELEGDSAVIVAEHDELGGSHLGSRVPLAEHPVLRQALEGTGASTGPADRMTGAARAGLEGVGATAAAYAPITVGGSPYGAIGVAHREPGAEFDPAELRLLEGMADLAGLALGNAERFRLAQERNVDLRLHGDRMAALDKVKSEFLRLASHELRGPLTVLRGYVSMLGDGSFGKLPEPATGAMPILSTKVEEMSRLIDQMLETARLEDSRLQLALSDADLRELVSGSVEALRPLAGPDHELRLNLPPEAVPVRVDRERMTTILTNLIDNAIKYSPNGGEVAVELSTGDSAATLTVTDHGLGVAKADMEKLFTRFGRIVTRENSHIPGTGLGLYLSRELALLHGGDITAVSAAGEGSTFSLRVPLSEVVA